MVDTAAPQNGQIGTEAQLAEILAGVLHTDRVPVDGDFFADLGADSLVMAQFCARVRKRDDLPTVSMKDIYRTPTIHGLAAEFPAAAPEPNAGDSGTVTDAPSQDLEAQLADVLAGVLHTDRVPVDGDFFADLGADSLVMAQFCARVRKRDDLPTV
ncbi:phosphopantetheine-binding protein, partial [Streptomyces sp. NPDC058685]|uniref:phosphopantetheine-binding protein n=1 Tax=Streptomyces sp. NPDC058685 TaxID=3346598 RepID=UPI0036603C85